MRELNSGTQKYTKVVAVDDAEFGANHEYHVLRTDNGEHLPTCVKFQKGPIKEHGINGVHNEDLLVIVLDRLKGFQNTEFKCKENDKAIDAIEETLLWLRKRTYERVVRNVEGTSTV